MSHQAVGHIAQAKQEYQAAILYGDPSLKQQATTGLNQLSKANTQIAYGGSPTSAPVLLGAESALVAAASPNQKCAKSTNFMPIGEGLAKPLRPCLTQHPVNTVISPSKS
jgi:hypothetical protein